MRMGLKSILHLFLKNAPLIVFFIEIDIGIDIELNVGINSVSTGEF